MRRASLFALDQDQNEGFRGVAQTGELFQGVLGGRRQSPQLPGHKVHHVAGVVLGADAIDVPLPAWRGRVEREQSFFGQLREELDRKEWITACLLVNELRQRPRAFQVAMQGAADEPADIVEPKRRQHDLTHPRVRFLDRLQRSQKRVSGTDLVVPIGADQQQVPHLRVRDQMLDEVERGGIQPLQIIEEQRERMLGRGERAKEAPKHQLKSVLRFLRRQVGNGRLFPDDELQFGNEVDHQLSVRAERLCQGAPPLLHFRFALDEDLADQGLEGLCKGRIGDVALVLIELACREKPARRHKHLVQLVDHRGFADAGIAGHQHELWRALRHDPIKGREQGGDLGLSPVELFRDQQSIRSVVRAQRKWIDATVRLPLAQATTQVGLDARGGLVTLLRGLREKLHHDRRKRLRNSARPLTRRVGLPCNMAVHPFHRIGSRKRKAPGQHFVKCHAERIEVAA